MKWFIVHTISGLCKLFERINECSIEWYRIWNSEYIYNNNKDSDNNNLAWNNSNVNNPINSKDKEPTTTTEEN